MLGFLYLYSNSIQVISANKNTLTNTQSIKNTKELSFVERVNYQTAIRDTYKKYAANQSQLFSSQSTQSLAETNPKETLSYTAESSVNDYLKKSNALETLWHKTISGEQLQAELDLFQKTQSPELVIALFTALNNDPYLIAECLIRPILIDKLVREEFAFSEKFHAKLKNDLLMQLQEKSFSELKNSSTANFKKLEYVKSQVINRKSANQNSFNGKLKLSPTHWNDLVNGLALDFGLSQKKENLPVFESNRLPIKTLSKLKETSTNFYVRSILDKNESNLKIATISWAKTSFDDWWQQNQNNFDIKVTPTDFNYTISDQIEPLVIQELLTNGNFDSNSSGSPWSFSGRAQATNNSSFASSPPMYVRIPINDPGTNLDPDNDFFNQEFTIPSSATSALLRFAVNAQSSEPASNTDLLFVRLFDANSGAFVADVTRVDASTRKDPAASYRFETFNLTAFKGRSLLLDFSFELDSADETIFRIDSVSIQADVATSGGGCNPVDVSFPLSRSGSLDSSDCMARFSGTDLEPTIDRPTDLYRFSGTAGQQITLTLTSSSFDAVLILTRGTGINDNSLVPGGFDDDSGGGTNSRISLTLPSTGSYILFVTRIGSGTGSYSLTGSLSSPGGGSCNAIDVSFPLNRSGSIDSSDCIARFSGTDLDATVDRPTDFYRFSGTAGQQITLTLTSSSFDTYLILARGTGINDNSLVPGGFDDDGGGGSNSRISLTLPSTGSYIIFVTRFGSNTGSYSLSGSLSGGGPGPSFSLTLTPATQTIQAGSTVTYTLDARSMNFPAGQGIALDVQTSNSNVRFGGLGSQTSFPISLQFSTSSSISPGTYNITVTGTSAGAQAQTVSAALVIQSAPQTDFRLNVSPSSQSANPGSSVNYTISIDPINGFNQSVNLSFSSTNGAISGNFSQSSITPGNASTLQVNVPVNTAANTVNLTITANSGSLSKVMSVALGVNNLAPRIDPVSSITLAPGDTREIDINFSDPNGSSGLNFSLGQRPGYVSVVNTSSNSARLRIAPSSSESPRTETVSVRVSDPGGLASDATFTITITPRLVINNATFSKPNLIISGVGFGSSGAIVRVNGVDVTSKKVSQDDATIILKGNKKKLALASGTNAVSVTVNGVTVSRTFSAVSNNFSNSKDE